MEGIRPPVQHLPMFLGESHVVILVSVAIGVGPTLGLVAGLSIIIVLVYVCHGVYMCVLIVWTSLFTVSICIYTCVLIGYTLSDVLYVCCITASRLLLGSSPLMSQCRGQAVCSAFIQFHLAGSGKDSQSASWTHVHVDMVI